MKNESNFLIVVVITVCVLIFYPMLMKRFLPQYFPDQPGQYQESPWEDKLTPATNTQDIEKQENSIQASELLKVKTSSKQKSYILENNRLLLVVNSPGADIESIKLPSIKDPATNMPTVLMNTENSTPGIFADLGIVENAMVERVEQNSETITFYYRHAAGLNIKKQITLNNDNYAIKLSIIIDNPSNKEYVLAYKIIAGTGLNSIDKLEGRYSNQITLLKNKKLQKKNLHGLKDNMNLEKIQLTGFMLRYFSLIMVPLVTTDFTYIYNYKSPEGVAPIGIGIGANRLVVPAQNITRLDYVLYAGPNDQVEMSKLNLGVEEIRGRGIFAGLSDLLLLLLRWLQKLFKNYGVAVIGLALTINLLLYPLTFKSLKSMKEMQTLQPLVEKIRNEHKDNPQKLNKEIMELYRKHKVNPAGGCLPMLLQMPVFFALYGVLMRAIELRGAGFLWIKDLSAPDAFISFPTKLPLLGSSLNLLPIIMMAFSFFQQKLTNPGQVNDQQKAMALMMPVLLGVIFYNFPSGLVLYFLTNSIFSVIIQSNISVTPGIGKA